MRQKNYALILFAIIISCNPLQIFAQHGWVNVKGKPLDIQFDSPSRGVACGENYLAYTTDAGDSWFSAALPVEGDLNAITLTYGAGHAYAVGSNYLGKCVIFSSADGGKKWKHENFVQNGELEAITTNYSSSTGYHIWVSGTVVAYNHSFEDVWEIRMNGLPQYEYFSDIKFMDDQIGFVATSYGAVYLTEDGGLNWTVKKAKPLVYENIRALWVSQSSTLIYAAGDRNGKPVVYRSQNRGDTWDELTIASSMNGYCSTIAVGSELFIGGHFYDGTNSGYILKAPQSFLGNWELLSVHVSTESIKSLFHISGETFFAVKDGIIKTTDNGVTWEGKDLPWDDFYINDIDFLDDNLGFMTGNHKSLLLSSDGGENWSIIDSSIANKNMHKIFFVDDSTGWACGSEGYVLKTTDRGNTWADASANTPVDLRAIHFIDRDHGWAVGGSWVYITPTNYYFSNVYCRTTDGGDSWAVSASSAGTQQNAVFFINSQKGWSAGNGGLIFATSDGGVVWDTISTIDASDYIYDIVFRDEQIGYAVGGTGPEVIYRTSDGGNNWTKVQSLNGAGIADIDFDSNGKGHAVGSHYWQSVTGYTWFRNSYVFNNFHGSCIDTRSDYLSWIGGGRKLYKYDRVYVTDLPGEEETVSKPHSFYLEQNYPNPFNPETIINYQLDHNSLVDLRIYDLLGNEITVLEKSWKPAGNYSIRFNADGLPSGVYFYRLQNSKGSLTKKMILIR